MEGSNNRPSGETRDVPSTPRACSTPEAARTHTDLARRASRGSRNATTIVPHSNDEGSCPRDVAHQGVVEAATPLADGGVDSDHLADRPGHGCGPAHGLRGVPAAAVSTLRSAATAETGLEDYSRGEALLSGLLRLSTGGSPTKSTPLVFESISLKAARLNIMCSSVAGAVEFAKCPPVATFCVR